MLRAVVLCWVALWPVAFRAVAQDQVGVFVTWPEDPTTGMILNWVNLYPRNTDVIWFRAADADASAEWTSVRAEQIQLDPSSLQLRRVELTGLTPGTTYRFGIGDRPVKCDVGDYLSLVMLDSGHTEPIPGPQAEWLAETLAARTRRPFLFVSYHFPAYGTAKGPRTGLPVDDPRSLEIREHWMPHLERFGVSAVFEHDHHTYKRSHRLRQHARDDVNGLLYLGDGAWGVRTRSVPTPEQGWWLHRAEPRNHLWCVDLHPSAGGNKPPTASVRAVDADGVVFDEFDLVPIRTRPVEPRP